ncbi:hypothetical protein LJC03_02805 [Methanobrevibacter sp. OttesenSCG-928-I08]|nr:hypothetical protein [Methanobrevibacter sp. OttesenSCG-928-I08]
MKKLGWKKKLGIILIIVSILIYAFAFYEFQADRVYFYIIIDLAFVPIDILIVVLIVENLINKKEKEKVLEKLDMILGVFFSEIGNNLLLTFLSLDNENKEIYSKLKDIKQWNESDYKTYLKYLEENDVLIKEMLSTEQRKIFIKDLREFLYKHRDFLIKLLINEVLLEKDDFSKLVLAIFHLEEELESRHNLNNITENDYNHLIGDMDRIYSDLIHEWIAYIQYLKTNYPYMYSITLRKNPFDETAEIFVND